MFRVTNFVLAPVVPVAPTPFLSPGFCSVSVGLTFPSHASIVAEPLPPGINIPALSARGLALLASLLVLASFAVVRRQRRI